MHQLLSPENTFSLMKLAWSIALQVAYSCAGAVEGGAWIRLPPSPMWDAQKLDSTSIHKVLVAKHDEAVGNLATSPTQAIQSDKLASWIGVNAKCQPGTQPFLLRSVSNGDDERTLEVRMRDTSVLVSNGALGRDIDLHPSPVVACLAKAPKELYVIYSTAE